MSRNQAASRPLDREDFSQIVIVSRKAWATLGSSPSCESFAEKARLRALGAGDSRGNPKAQPGDTREKDLACGERRVRAAVALAARRIGCAGTRGT